MYRLCAMIFILSARLSRKCGVVELAECLTAVKAVSQFTAAPRLPPPWTDSAMQALVIYKNVIVLTIIDLYKAIHFCINYRFIIGKFSSKSV